jgi:tetratricopeptide (TPR) repeat protein
MTPVPFISESLAQAVAFHSQGQLAEAAQCFERILRTDPTNAEALKGLGFVLAQQGKFEEAIGQLRLALLHAPGAIDVAEFLEQLLSVQDNQQGNALATAGKWEEAEVCYRQALARRPDFVEAHYNLALSLVNRDRLGEAITSFQQALALRPTSAEIAADLQLALKLQEKSRGGTPTPLQGALEAQADSAEGYFNRANGALEQGRLDEAEDFYRRALALKPDFAEAHSNLGFALLGQHKLDEALGCGRRAVQLKLDDPDTHFNHAFTLLTMGRFAEGWAEFDWRWHPADGDPTYLGRPRWTGSAPAGRTILLRVEEGLGDTLQFIRYVDLVEQQGAKVLVEVRAPLAPLLAHSRFADRLVTKQMPLRDFDFHIPLLGLPRVFSTTLETIPGGVPYVSAAPRLVEHWRGVFGAASGLRVGIAWQGNPYFRADRFRSFPLVALAPLALPGVELISLQKGAGAEQIAGIAGTFSVRDFGHDLDEQHGPFMDTAALMMNLDLVVTSDSAVAHLAGALGVPVWLALSFAPDWRWLLDREDSPWYPTMRLFRQPRPGDWPRVFERMAAELQRSERKGTGVKS